MTNRALLDIITEMKISSKIKTEIVEALKNNLGYRFKACVLFGSVARSVAHEKSDIDLLVVTKGLSKNTVKRRSLIQAALTEVRNKLKRDISIVDFELREFEDVTPLLINIAHDGVILYDKDRKITKLFDKIRKAVKKAGLVRYYTPTGKYGWKPIRPLKRGERIVVKLEE